MIKNIYQVLVKFTYTNEIKVYNFADVRMFEEFLKQVKKDERLLFTNVAAFTIE